MRPNDVGKRNAFKNKTREQMMMIYVSKIDALNKILIKNDGDDYDYKSADDEKVYWLLHLR